MTVIAGIGFSAPWLLLGLLALPVLWFLLRAVPPAPITRAFPGVVLLLGLANRDQVTDRTPWWLLLLRMLVVAAVIIGLSGPVLNPPQDTATRSQNANLLIVMDGSWASASDWRARMTQLQSVVTQAGRDERQVAVLNLSAPETPQFVTADVILSRMTGFVPMPWAPSEETALRAIDLLPDAAFDSYWLSDGLARESRTAVLAALGDKGSVSVFETGRNLVVLLPPKVENGLLTLTARRQIAGAEQALTIVARGKDPAGNSALLYEAAMTLPQGENEAVVTLSLPAELRGRIEQFQLQGARGAGAVTLPDDSLRRREVALIAGTENREGLELLSPLHYLRKALEPTADLLGGSLNDVLPANPDAIILADVARLGPQDQAALIDWVEQGGTLLRFAGVRMAASDLSRVSEDPLMPVRLRAGGRSVGGAMSWGEPKSLAPFAETGPFLGLPVPEDVAVTSQVVAQPDPTLAERAIAQLSDGTPLVTRKAIGQGQVVLFHVTANAEWSSLPLSGLFVQMLERLAVSARVDAIDVEDLEGTVWQPSKVLDGFGVLRDADTLPGVAGPALLQGTLGPDLQPGIYQGSGQSFARNVVLPETSLSRAEWPADISVEGLREQREHPLMGWFLVAALSLFAVDALASLAVSGRLWGARVASVLVLFALPYEGWADDALALAATSELRLGYVITGDADLDRMSQAGLQGLSDTLFFRTSVEPASPLSVVLENDDLSFFPFLYWPITASQPTPSPAAYAKLNTYLRSGGMILFDTRDADIAGFGGATANGRKLQQLASGLDIPPLEPVPQDHVLTRSFYLLNDFPGRYTGRSVWVEAAPPDAEQVEGMPFRDLNDNVTPVVIGGNDWAAAWAVNDNGVPLVRLGSGFTGERQREIANRFGVNLVMYVLTGNYKSDQVHVPALLDRLGQ
ncbi:MAG: DUF4159 domain-containing protein [Pelagimonas sp.]|jgi:hypothetical protein|nr:DUF4159 domain-containing protein [Pelagimonas sp.]